jgi:hypothetical protein
MSFQERRSIVPLLSTILISALYAAYIVQRYLAGRAYSLEVFHFWGAFFLVLTAVSMAAKIGIYIAFKITNTIATKEEEPSIRDEHDKVITLKATRNFLYVFASGMFLAMGSLVLDMPPSVMFVILICSGIVSQVATDISQFYFYRRGF